MLDIVSIEDGKDLGIANSAAPRAANVASTQMGEKNFLAPTFGVDLKYFLANDFQFQTISFQAYLVQRLVEHKISVGEVVSILEPLVERMTFPVGDAETSKGLVS